ncbi:MAG: hypothetical protein KIT27_02950 [Legionellales bacterium]|nr:hypothetical protein [Legionellales bacterium]
MIDHKKRFEDRLKISLSAQFKNESATENEELFHCAQAKQRCQAMHQSLHEGKCILKFLYYSLQKVHVALSEEKSQHVSLTQNLNMSQLEKLEHDLFLRIEYLQAMDAAAFADEKEAHVKLETFLAAALDKLNKNLHIQKNAFQHDLQTLRFAFSQYIKISQKHLTSASDLYDNSSERQHLQECKKRLLLLNKLANIEKINHDKAIDVFAMLFSEQPLACLRYRESLHRLYQALADEVEYLYTRPALRYSRYLRRGLSDYDENENNSEDDDK